jgi:hypothetical protein
VEAGLPKTQVLLWVYGEQLRATFETVMRAEDHGRDDWQHHAVRDIGEGVLYRTRFASLQESLIPLTPQESLVVYHPRPPRRRAVPTSPMRQLWLCEWVPSG